MRIWRSVSRSCCSFCRFTETFTSGNTPSVRIVNTVMVITSSISEKPRCFISFTVYNPQKSTKSTDEIIQTRALFVPLDGEKHLLLHGCCSLSDLRHTSRASVATRCNVSFTKTSEALPAPIASRSINSSGPDPLNDALPFRLEIEIRHVPDASIDGVNSGAVSPEVASRFPACYSMHFHNLRIKLQSQQRKTERNIRVQLNCIPALLANLHHVAVRQQTELGHT